MPFEYESLENLDDKKIVEGILNAPGFMNGMSWLNVAEETDFCFTVARKLFDPFRGSVELIDEESIKLVLNIVERISTIDSRADPYGMAVQRLARICLVNEDSEKGYSREVAWNRYEHIKEVFNIPEHYDKLRVIDSLGRYIRSY